MVVRVGTDDPELHGLGCATYTQRPFAVRDAVRRHLRPLVVGRDAARVDDLHRLMMQHGDWRDGPVLNAAVSGVDMALWDLKGRAAGMPVYDLVGGAYCDVLSVYRTAQADTIEALIDTITAFQESSVRHIRPLESQVEAWPKARLPDGPLVCP